LRRTLKESVNVIAQFLSDWLQKDSPVLFWIIQFFRYQKEYTIVPIFAFFYPIPSFLRAF